MSRALALVAMVAAWGCGSSAPNHLDGSMSAVFSFDFDTVTLNQVGDYLVVEYVRASDQAPIVKLTVYTTDLQIMPGVAFDLTDRMPPRGTLEHITDTTLELPIQTGTLSLDQVPAPAMHLSGHFLTSVQLSMSTRTLDGDFDGTLVKK